MTTPAENPDYFRNAYPEAWNLGYSQGATAQPNVPLTIPPEVVAAGTNDAWSNGLQRGMNDQAQAARDAAAAAAQAAQQANTFPPQTFIPPVVQQAAQYVPPAVAAAVAPPAVFTPPAVAPPGAVVAPPAAAPQQFDMLAQMQAELAQEQAVAQAAPAVTSPGGFALLEGIEDDLAQGSGEPFLFANPGDQIIGMIEWIGEIQSDYVDVKTGQKKMVPIMDIRDQQDKLWSVRGYGSAMVNQIEKANPEVGDGIIIKFNAMATPKSGGGQPYKDVTVRVRKPIR